MHSCLAATAQQFPITGQNALRDQISNVQELSFILKLLGF